MALDRTRALKLECPAEGGTQLDMGPTEVNPKQDAMDAAGYYVQSASGPAGGDTSVLYGRLGSVAQVVDTSGSLTMAQTVSVNAASGGAQHTALRDLSHFLGGPAEGFASGAVQAFVYSTTTGLPQSMTWYTDSTLKLPIYSETYSYTGAAPASAICRSYDASGNVLVSVTETYTTSAGQITQTMRTR